ncbi:MAG: type II secretion system F family protein [Bacillota bacterium]|nr:type II secretion system F family protein [Bacillota bacterium]MDD3298917.1 type II secretion system F family protein [Bacillota bacterium]MDD3850910.1 type II secretion system F family protein [Bacillota bacterium]MDD4708297.1 type II secretion system F family protein [Bacillota bacterium]
MEMFFIFSLVFSTLYLYYFMLIFALYKGKLRQSDRIDKYLAAGNPKDRKERQAFSTKTLIRRIGRSLMKEDRSARLELQLLRAGILLKSEEYIIIVYLSVLLPPILIYMLTGNIFASAVTAVAGLILPRQLLNASIRKRLNRFNQQLPDAINVMIYALKSGLSLIQAVESVANEMSDPIKSEFQRMLNEITLLSRPRNEALENMGRRVNSDDLDLVVTAIIIQSQVGGNLAEVLENIVETVRDRITIKGEIRAITAQGRISGVIVASIPVFVGAMILIMDPGYLKPLVTEPIGWLLIGFCIISEFLGFMLMKRIMTIDF